MSFFDNGTLENRQNVASICWKTPYWKKTFLCNLEAKLILYYRLLIFFSLFCCCFKSWCETPKVLIWSWSQHSADLIISWSRLVPSWPQQWLLKNSLMFGLFAVENNAIPRKPMIGLKRTLWLIVCNVFKASFNVPIVANSPPVMSPSIKSPPAAQRTSIQIFMTSRYERLANGA